MNPKFRSAIRSFRLRKLPLSLAVFTALFKPSPWHLLFLLALPLHHIHLKGIWTRTERELDPMLPLLVMSTFILSLILGISFIAA